MDDFYGLPNDTQFELLREQALASADEDLPLEDRSTREVILQDRELNVRDVVSVTDGMAVMVVAPGRGRDAFQAGWTEEGSPCLGTFFANQIAEAPP